MKNQLYVFGFLATVFAVATSCGPQDTTAQDMEMAAMRAVMAQGGPGAGGGGGTTTVTQTNTITKTSTTTVTNTNTSTNSATN